MDVVTLGGSFFEIAVAIGVIYLLRKQRFRITFGIGGSLLLLGLTLLGMAYDVISGVIAWIPVTIAIALFVGFFLVAVRSSHGLQPV
jgi:hypothetical protein